MTLSRWSLIPVAVVLAIGPSACGPSDEELAMRKQLEQQNADLIAAKNLHDEDQRKFAEAQNDIATLRTQLEETGIAGKRTKAEADALKKALSEYKVRADQLAAMEQRFRDLKSRLEKLTQVGVKFVVRNNRMVIQLPGDILFDSGKDELKQAGKDVLLQVADVVRNDRDLNSRNFQVAGHTDKVQYPRGGPFRDNWGLSLARARQVLLFLIAPAAQQTAGKPKAIAGAENTGGGLDPKHWSAAGYGETDPLEGTVESQTPDQMAKNRRVELVLQPNVDEMLDLTRIK